jgi:hypothetical protein
MKQLTEHYLEDFAVGQTFGSGRFRIDGQRARAFAAEFDPQPFHLDETAARHSIFGEMTASGWHTAAVTMRLLVETELKPAGGFVGAGLDECSMHDQLSPASVEALVRGRLDVAFLRAEPAFDLRYEVVDHEPLIVLMPSDHRLTSRKAIHPRELVGEIFIGGSNKASVLHAVTEDYLRRSWLDIKLAHGVDNLAMAMSLVASTRGLALLPAYAKNLLPWSVVSRPLEGEPPTIDLAVGYSKANTSPILKLFLSRMDELTVGISGDARRISGSGSAAAPR